MALTFTMDLPQPNLLEAKVNREMIKISRRIICVCDSSKFGRAASPKSPPLSSIHQVITDNKIPKADLNELTEAGIKVTTV